MVDSGREGEQRVVFHGMSSDSVGTSAMRGDACFMGAVLDRGSSVSSGINVRRSGSRVR